MINLTDEMVSRLDSALADGYSCLVGTASKDGEPQISPKGSVMAFNRDTLAYWERAKRSALDNVAENPQVVVYYAHAADRVGGGSTAGQPCTRTVPFARKSWTAASKPNWTGILNAWVSPSSSR